MINVNRAYFSINNVTIFFMLLLMAVFSTIFMKLKIAISLCTIFILFITKMFSYSQITVNKGIVVWMAIYLINNAIPILVASIYKNPNAMVSLNVDIIEPIIFFVLILFVQKNELDGLFQSLKTITFAICLYNIMYFLSVNGFSILNSEWFPGMYVNNGGFSIGFNKYHSNNIAWLFFLLPIVISEYILNKEKRNAFNTTIVVLGLINVLACLRSVFIIVIAITPFITIMFAKISGLGYDKKEVRLFMFAGGMLLLSAIIASGSIRAILFGMLSKVLLSFSTTTNAVDSGGHIRAEQIMDLLNTWKDRPLLGWGASANAHNVVRSDISGAYEMQYFAMLMQKGVLGFGVVIALYGWLYQKSFKLVRRNNSYSLSVLTILVGHMSILLANATNPYIGSFDRLFIVFIPLCVYRVLADIEVNDNV